jgi:hypothetical protein
MLTETALLRDRLDAALVCSNRAVALDPEDPIAHILLAKCLILSGEPAAARQAAETAAWKVGREAEALDALGAIFGLLGEHHRAAELFRRVVRARPGVPQYLFNLAATERMTGLLEAAESHCDAAIAIDPRYARAHYLRADLRIQTPERNHVAEMESLCSRESADWSRAFEHVAAACERHRRSIRYDAAAELAEIDAIIRGQTRQWLASQPRGYEEAEPVFVAGLPRTGTTLVERILASHSAMSSVGETNVFAAELRRATQGGDGAVTPALGRRYVEAVTAAAGPRTPRFVDKTLQNYLHCGIIHAALPRAKIILVRRHPLDAGWAMYKAHFLGKFAFSYDQVEIADYYLAFRRLAQHWRATLPPEALLEVAYEDVVADQARASRRIVEFIGLPWEEGVLRFHESAAPSATASAVQIRRPVYSTSVGAWRRHADRLQPLRARLGQQIPASELD